MCSARNKLSGDQVAIKKVRLALSSSPTRSLPRLPPALIAALTLLLVAAHRSPRSSKRRSSPSAHCESSSASLSRPCTAPVPLELTSPSLNRLLHHFRGHKNVRQALSHFGQTPSDKALPTCVSSPDPLPLGQITCLYDLDLVDPVNFDSVYLYEECMEADLHAIVRPLCLLGVHTCPGELTQSLIALQIRSGQPLSDAHFQSFIYQTLCGLKVRRALPRRLQRLRGHGTDPLERTARSTSTRRTSFTATSSRATSSCAFLSTLFPYSTYCSSC